MNFLNERFHRARAVTPFADGAANNSKDKLLLQIAIQHGYKDIRQFAKVAGSEYNLNGECVLEAMQAAANEIEQNGGQVDFMQLLNMYLPHQSEGEQKTLDLKPGVHFVSDKGIIKRKKI